MKSIDQTIRAELPGKSNAGLRAQIRAALSVGPDWQIASAARVRSLAHTVALTGRGLAALERIACRVDAETVVV